MAFFNPKKSSVKTNIINILSLDYPKSAKQLYYSIKTKFQVSYQYVHKALKELEHDGILLEDTKMYELNPDWVNNLQLFVDNIDLNYKLSYKIFSRFTNSMMVDFLDKEERKELSREIEEVISHKATIKLNEWYSKYYDYKDKEYKAILDIINLDSKRVLELGCGTGRLTKRLVKDSKQLVAVERNRECIDYCKENITSVDFLHKDIRDLSKDDFDSKFDVIVSSWIGLHYLSKKELEDFLKFTRTILSKNGTLIILEAYYNTDYVNILDLLTSTKNNIKEHLIILKESLIEEFGTIDEKVVMTDYTFPSYELIEETFKVELEYEERVHWTESMSKKLKKYLNENNLKHKISEAPIIFVCRNS